MKILYDKLSRLNELYGQLSEATLSNNTLEYQDIFDSFMINIRDIKQELRKITNCSNYNMSNDDKERRSENMRKNRFNRSK